MIIYALIIMGLATIRTASVYIKAYDSNDKSFAAFTVMVTTFVAYGILLHELVQLK